MKFLGFFLVCLTAVSGFVAPSPRLSTAVRGSSPSTPMRMGIKEDVQTAINTAAITVLTAAPAFATEGTGEPLGFENKEAVIVPLFILGVINAAFNSWSKKQPEGDFFSEYDQRQK